MNTKVNEIEINGVKYVPKGSQEVTPALGDYAVIRCRNAGVHAGYVESRDANVLVIRNSRRLWQWWSKFTLSGLASTGVLKGKEDQCKFSCVSDKIELTCSDVAEVIYCTEEAKISIQSIKETTNE